MHDAERTLFSARQDLLTARLARQLTVVELYAALGGGWEENARENRRREGMTHKKRRPQGRLFLWRDLVGKGMPRKVLRKLKSRPAWRHALLPGPGHA